jgi:hypothetical protein
VSLRLSLDKEMCRAQSEIDCKQLSRPRGGSRSVGSTAAGGEVRRIKKGSTKESRVFDADRVVVVAMASPGNLERPLHFAKVSSAPKGRRTQPEGRVDRRLFGDTPLQ